MRSLGIVCGLLFWLVGCTSSTPSEEVPEAASPPPTVVTAVTITPPTPTPEPGPTDANADVLFVDARETALNIWTFAVTVAHPDTGWEDYADGWDVVLPDGTAVKPDPDSPFTRLLLHPHETEQPFTRSRSGISIPPDVITVTVRAHDLVAGFGGQEIQVNLEDTAETKTYSVTRWETTP